MSVTPFAREARFWLRAFGGKAKFSVDQTLPARSSSLIGLTALQMGLIKLPVIDET
jgi:hypothetical protein